MKTKILKNNEAIVEGVKLIKAGEVVAFPTETVYGLGGNALDRFVVDKIYKAKGRPADNPLIVHVSKIEDIYPLTAEVSQRNAIVAKAFMPGPITLLFPKSNLIPDEVTAGLSTVGIRIPSNPIAREFIEKCGVPIAAPSANRSTHISPTTAEHVFNDMDGQIPLIIDGGESSVGIESTVLDLTGEIPTILRPGAITEDMLLCVLDKLITHKGEVLSVAKAPGMKYKHYAPSVEMVVCLSEKAMRDIYASVILQGLNPVIMADSDTCSRLTDCNVIDLGVEITDVCRNVYKAMHSAEKQYDYIISQHFGMQGLGGAIMNRVLKAAANKVVE